MDEIVEIWCEKLISDDYFDTDFYFMSLDDSVHSSVHSPDLDVPNFEPEVYGTDTVILANSFSCITMAHTQPDMVPPINLKAANITAELDRFFDDFRSITIIKSWDTKLTPEQLFEAIVLYAGAEAKQKIRNLAWAASEVKDPKAVKAKLLAALRPQTTEVMMTFNFRHTTLGSNQLFDTFLEHLHATATQCNFGDEAQLQRHVRDQIIFGHPDRVFQRELVLCTTYEGVVTKCRAYEQARQAGVLFASQASANVHAIHDQATPRKVPRQDQDRPAHGQLLRYCDWCRFAEGQHTAGNCPAYGKPCKRCGVKNHLDAACRAPSHKAKAYQASLPSSSRSAHPQQQTRQGPPPARTDAVHSADPEVLRQLPSVSDLRNALQNKFQYSGQKRAAWYENVAINGKCKPMKIDCGSEVSIIDWNTFCWLHLDEAAIQPPTRRLFTYLDEEIMPIGQIEVQLKLRGRTTRSPLFIIEEPRTPLLSFSAGIDLGLFVLNDSMDPAFVTAKFLNELIQDNPDFYEPALKFIEEEGYHVDSITAPIGRYHKPVKIKLKPTAYPVQFSARRLPYKLRDQVKAELANMIKFGIIEPVAEATEWVHPMLIVHKKNGAIRICLDPRVLNKYIERATYQIPDPDFLLSQLAEAEVMTVLDLECGFWQIPVDEETSRLLTFATPFGRFRFKRLPFGVSSAPEEFHRIIAETLEGIEGVVVYIDDIFIHGPNQAVHDARLAEVKKRLHVAGFSLNDDKCQIAKASVKFLGHVVSKGMLSPDPDKIDSICEIEVPQSKKELRSIVGLIGWFQKFIPNQSDLIEPFAALLKEDAEWIWTPDHDAALSRIKDKLRSILPLRIFDPSLPVTIAADASPVGLGAVLMQENEPVFFVSRKLSRTERDYPQLERELLSLVFALERFHVFSYGNQVTLLTDHEPLIRIVNKEFSKLNVRQARLVARLLPYDFTPKFIPGKDMTYADFLSRYVAGTEYDPRGKRALFDEQIPIDHAFIHDIESLPIEDPLTSEMRVAYEACQQMQIVKQALIHGWKDAHRKTIPKYWPLRGGLSLGTDNFLYFENRLLVPETMQGRVLKSLHAGHAGMRRMILRAQSAVFWPGITNQIREFARSCEKCQILSASQPREPMLSLDIPPAPGLEICSDYFYLQGQDYVLFVDLFSNFVEIYALTNKQTEELKRVLRQFMLRNGVPRLIHSDNGPAYTSYEFDEFCKFWGIAARTNSADYPRGNGTAEAAVKRAKKILKTVSSEDELIQAIIALNQTPLSEVLPSPVQIQQGRNFRDDLHPRVIQTPVSWEEVREARTLIRQKEKTRYDQHTRPLVPIPPNTEAIVQRHEKFERALVLDQVQTRPRSYRVELENGTIIERNRIHIKPFISGHSPLETIPISGMQAKKKPFGSFLTQASFPVLFSPPDLGPSTGHSANLWARVAAYHAEQQRDMQQNGSSFSSGDYIAGSSGSSLGRGSFNRATSANDIQQQPEPHTESQYSLYYEPLLPSPPGDDITPSSGGYREQPPTPVKEYFTNNRPNNPLSNGEPPSPNDGPQSAASGMSTTEEDRLLASDNENEGGPEGNNNNAAANFPYKF